jgi:hypothetical protein
MRKRILWMLPAGAAAVILAAVGLADSSSDYTSVAANQRAAGYAPANVVSTQLREVPVAHGSIALDGATGIVGWYGYEKDTPSPTNAAFPQMVPATLAAPAEAQKTEPDKNTYLVLKNQHGPDSGYDYGTHFLFQGHEAGATVAGAKQGLITRINLDADDEHRVTLLATKDDMGNSIATIDGSTWDPFAKRLLLTTENASAPTYSATADYPSTVHDVSGALGRGGYEGIQNDGDGNIWIVEDIGGANKPGTTAKIPNSFVYRYVPRRPGDLANGKLQVLQVWNAGHPVTVETQTAVNAPDQVALRTYGMSFETKWVTIHDTASDGTTPFNANTLAKAAHGTPFKRPENGLFRPGSHFTEFFFDETGDTNATSVENGTAGGWTSVFKLTQSDPSADSGRLSLFFQSKSAAVAGLDNVAFLTKNLITFVEDAGDTLHGQRNALDSGWLFDVTKDYSQGAMPVRWLAEGRDASATLDAANGGFGKNDGDNEITGTTVSDGDPGVGGILGAKSPHFGDGHGQWRFFWTQQHGDNVTWEVVPASNHDDENGDD